MLYTKGMFNLAGTNIPWPNPQYSLDTIYYFFTGQHLQVVNGWGSVFYWFQELQLIGILLSAVLLVMFIYLHLKLEALHHRVHEHRHEEEHAVASVMHARATSNPNREHWERIMNLMGSGNPNDWRSAIMDADVMLDALLTERGFVGMDVGEKLQSASRGQFGSLEAAWDAHRTRNRIAHGGPDFTLSDREARQAIDGYRRVFEEFNYI